ncbi:MAG: lipoyl domain-containing protein [Variibacter sp.]|nr:lipoyl domain-containing protein [Variibacter sp.]
MRIRIKVPKIGLTIEEVTLTWERNVGDQIAAEEVIAVMEADKATYELTAPAAGILVEQLAAPGAVVPVGTEVAVIQT